MTKILLKFLKGRWGQVLPAIFKAAAEGKFGEPIKRAYWFLAAYKTITGAVLWGAGSALESVCSSYPDFAWTCSAAPYLYYIGMFLTGVGLADGGTRAPWPKTPDGQPPFPPEEKHPA